MNKGKSVSLGIQHIKLANISPWEKLGIILQLYPHVSLPSREQRIYDRLEVEDDIDRK